MTITSAMTKALLVVMIIFMVHCAASPASHAARHPAHQHKAAIHPSSAGYHTTRDPLRLITHELRRLHDQKWNGGDSDIGFLATSTPTSSCGNSLCTSYSDCPIFSEFYYVQCSNLDTCVYSPTWVDNLCNNTNQCNTGDCVCGTLLSEGCECDYYGNYGPCEDACIKGICQPANGFYGEACDANFTCHFGGCSSDTHTCVPVQEGGDCSVGGNDACVMGMYCADNFTCLELPPCSDAAPFNGSCPSPAEYCIIGKCLAPVWVQEGDVCGWTGENITMCAMGLLCVMEDANATAGTCLRIPEGTQCTTDSDCEPVTQNCMCVKVSDASPTQCVNSQFASCPDILQNALACYNEYCQYYESDAGTPCYDECFPSRMELTCCMICNNQQHYDNALFNYAGTCVENNVRPVPCCNTDGTPCTILAVSDMCAGYTQND